MKNKTIFSLLSGYVLGMFVMLRHKTKGKELTPQKAIKEMTDVHQDMLSDFSVWIESDEAKKIIENWKKAFEDVAADFPEEAKKLMETLKKEGVATSEQIQKELDKLFEEKKVQINRMKKHSLELYKDIQETVKDTVDETLETLEDHYKDLVKKLKKS